MIDLSSALTTLAYGWRLLRRDGVALGFTSHDRNVRIGDLLYRAAPGLVPGGVTWGGADAAGGLDIDGVLSSGAITADDLDAGRWDGAALRLFLYDWSDPDAGTLRLSDGWLGAVHYDRSAGGGGQFRAELRDWTQILTAPVVPMTSPGCRADFGDADCGMPLPRFVWRASAQVVEGAWVTVTGDASLPPLDRFVHGRLRWLGGPNGGLVQPLFAADNGALILDQPPAFAVETGTRVLLTEGCDRDFATCAERFANAVNFRGEPHLPGMDLLTRYPGG